MKPDKQILLAYVESVCTQDDPAKRIQTLLEFLRIIGGALARRGGRTGG